jgi:hypothetical protein
MSKLKVNKTDPMCWEIECDSVEDLNTIGIELEHQASTNNLGNPKTLDTISPVVIHFHIIFNGLDVEFQSARDLWFWAHGLQVAAAALPVKFLAGSSKTSDKILN